MRGTFQVATQGSWEEWNEVKRHLLAVHNKQLVIGLVDNESHTVAYCR